jgi:tRNA threonylcarbamoyl adenosine modification protein (Sua5/YciO/YrdC/YwlC family)
MMIKVYPENPAPRHIHMIVDMLRDGAVIIYPTDTVYAIGCDMKNQKAIDRLCQIIGKKPEEARLSLICHDLSNLSEYTVPFDNRIYKLMKKTLPGPYTYILKSNNKVPKLFKNKKKTIGIRVPDNNIPREIVKELGNPIITASIHDNKALGDYFTDPEEIHGFFKDKVDLVIHGGFGDKEGSTVIDCSNGEIEIVREGKGSVEMVPEA